MSQAVVLGLVRHVLTAAGPVVALLGVTDQATFDLVAGAGLTVAGTVWSVFDKLRKRR
jgi:pantothenate kinase